MAPSQSGEITALDRLARRLSGAPAGETWLGDDTAVLDVASVRRALFSTDAVVEGVHFDRTWCTLADVGWKALAVNVSDIAAMGGRPLGAVVSVVGASADELEELYDGLAAASARFCCPIVGGDLSSADQLSITVAIVGTVDGPPVLRSGARVGDVLFVTDRLGGSSAGLRQLRADAAATGPLAEAHRRPTARLAEGGAARRAGATAMIDISDGLGLDLDRLAVASGVGVALDWVPVREGSTLEDALGGGEDYELLFCAGDAERIDASFAADGLTRPLRIGTVCADPAIRTLAGGPLARAGFEHRLG